MNLLFSTQITLTKWSNGEDEWWEIRYITIIKYIIYMHLRKFKSSWNLLDRSPWPLGECFHWLKKMCYFWAFFSEQPLTTPWNRSFSYHPVDIIVHLGWTWGWQRSFLVQENQAFSQPPRKVLKSSNLTWDHYMTVYFFVVYWEEENSGPTQKSRAVLTTPGDIALES